MFTANEQSMNGATQWADRARDHRQLLPYTKPDLTVIPLISRWDGAEEQVEKCLLVSADYRTNAEVYDRWSAHTVSKEHIFEQLRVPHVPYFSFGEKLAVTNHSVTDHALPGRSYIRLAALLDSMDWNDSEVRADEFGRRIGALQKDRTNLYKKPKRVFISAVGSEFESYRLLLQADLGRPTLDVAIQEDFVVSNGYTLQKLDTYIQFCDAVVHLIGKALGAIPEAVAVKALLEKYPDISVKLRRLPLLLRNPIRVFPTPNGKPILRFTTRDQSLSTVRTTSIWRSANVLAKIVSDMTLVRRKPNANITDESATWVAIEGSS